MSSRFSLLWPDLLFIAAIIEGKLVYPIQRCGNIERVLPQQRARVGKHLVRYGYTATELDTCSNISSVAVDVAGNVVVESHGWGCRS